MRNLTRRNRRRRNNQSNTSVFSYQGTPYKSYDDLSTEDQQFVDNYIQNKGSEQNNIDLATKNNKDELWYNIWHRMYAPKVDSPKYTTPTTDKVPEVTPDTSPNYDDYFRNFDANREAVDYQMDYYKKHGFFDYSPLFVGWDTVGDYLNTTKLDPNDLYDILKRYYNR